MKKMDFGKHGVSYTEAGEYVGYIAIVDMGNFFDIRAALAKDEEEAKTAIEAKGGDIIAIFTIMEALSTLDANLKNPKRDPALPRMVLMMGDGGPVL